MKDNMNNESGNMVMTTNSGRRIHNVPTQLAWDKGKKKKKESGVRIIVSYVGIFPTHVGVTLVDEEILYKTSDGTIYIKNIS